MRHITLTGPFAGVPICGCNRVEQAEKGDLFSHFPTTQGERFLQLADLCPACKRMWLEEGR